ncbi:gag-pol polyprotein [Cucumis melo var. makuwa]|uniref:Gag-pol polyprotein n=1 Tax=Cucumis melo var. makuwa TaxID=1194695 RepID=A0A5D3DD91_CUCMM|nr:gag-pol polyprotein [Cucumis melo var. makuwa]
MKSLIVGQRSPKRRCCVIELVASYIILSFDIIVGFLHSIDSVHEGTSTTRLTILDGVNYACWKARMIVFLKSIDSKCWKVVIIGWEHLSTKDAASKVTLKPKISWSKEEDEASLGNSRALNVLFNGIDQNVFKLINTALKMVEDKTIVELNVHVMDLANKSFSFGENLSNTKLVRKVLRSLPSCFNMKITAIEDAHDITTMKLDQLFKFLRTFELSLDDNVLKKEK